MLKLFLKIHKKRGFTLTELIIVVALIALIMACIVGFAGPIRNAVTSAAAKSDAITINRTIGDYINKRLAYANHIEVKVGYDFDTYAVLHSGEASSAAKKLNKRDSGTAYRKNIAGVLLFKYGVTEDVGASASDTVKNSANGTYKIYDIDINEFENAETLQLKAGKTYKDYQVFSDAFYSNYSYFIGVPKDGLAIDVNTPKGRAYMTFEVDSYNLKEGLTDAKLSKNLLVDHFRYLLGAAAAESLDDIKIARSGVERTTFSLENIPLDLSTGSAYGTIKGDKATISYPSAADAATLSDTDVIIYYNIKREWKN